MSEEAAFLTALKANPADDTARLVFADWLDEHNQAAKAAYLRAAVDLTRLSGGSTEYADAAGRLYTACYDTEARWREEAGRRFDVVLEGYEPAYKIQAIKIVRERTGFGLAEAKALAESAPTPLFSWLTFETALPHLLGFHLGGARGRRCPVQASIRPTAWPEGASGAVFDVLLNSTEFGHWSSYALAGVARLLNVSTEEALERLRSLPLVVGPGLHPTRVAEFVRQLKLSCNVGGTLPPDAIQVVPRLPTAKEHLL
jgi:uncharacterized protein (TIGR02996 family)